MNKILDFLKTLDNYELAYFAKYNSASLPKEAFKEFEYYVLDKELSEERILELVSTNPKREIKKGQIRCERCASDKIEINKNGLNICKVCGSTNTIDKLQKKDKPFWHSIADGVFNFFT